MPPPGEGLVAVIDRQPGPARSVAGMDTFTCVELMYDVDRLFPSHSTDVEGTNPVPVSVTLTAADPMVTWSGLMELMVGIGLPTVRGRLPEVPPPGWGL